LVIFSGKIFQITRGVQEFKISFEEFVGYKWVAINEWDTIEQVWLGWARMMDISWLRLGEVR
jgi:hypothetical protein